MYRSYGGFVIRYPCESANKKNHPNRLPSVQKTRWFQPCFSGCLVNTNNDLATSETRNPFFSGAKSGPVLRIYFRTIFPCKFVNDSWAQFMEGLRNRTLGIVGSRFLLNHY